MLSTVASFHFNERRATKSGLSSLTSRASNLLFHCASGELPSRFSLTQSPDSRASGSAVRPPAPLIQHTTEIHETTTRETSTQLGRRRRERSRQQLLAQSGIVAASWKKKTRVMSEMN